MRPQTDHLLPTLVFWMSMLVAACGSGIVDTASTDAGFESGFLDELAATDECNHTEQCKKIYGSIADDCFNSRSQFSVCHCDGTPCSELTGSTDEPDPEPEPVPPTGDECNHTEQCKKIYGSIADDCFNSRSQFSVCHCDGMPCSELSGSTDEPEPEPVPPTGDECNHTTQCKEMYGSAADDCFNSRTNRSVCYCDDVPCWQLAGQTDDCSDCAQRCGDGTCDDSESCADCSADCGDCAPSCGDGACDDSESCADCSADCGFCAPACGDGVCEGGESCSLCAADCGGCDTSADFFVNLSSGSDDNDGSAGRPWKSIAKANAGLRAGETIEVQAATAGGESTYFDDPIEPQHSGVEGAEITFRVRPGDRVRVEADPFCANLESVSYVVIDGFLLGNTSHWRANDFRYSYPYQGGLMISGSHHIDIRNVEVSGSNRWDANEISDDSRFVRILDSRFDLHGTNDNSNGDDWGDLLAVRGDYGVIEGCTFSHGGHNTLSVLGSGWVVRNNAFSGDWRDKNTGSPGSRAANFISAKGGSPYGPLLAEYNTFTGAADSADARDQAAHKVQGLGIILRFNHYWDNEDRLWNMGGLSQYDPRSVGTWRIYHNTSFGAGSIQSQHGGSSSGKAGMFGDEYFVNNLFQRMGTPISANIIVSKRTSDVPLDGYRDGWKGAVWSSNLFHRTDDKPMDVRLVGVTGAIVSLVEAHSRWPKTWKDNRIEAVTFINAAARTPEGFALGLGSPGKDEAEPVAMTTAQGSGSMVAVSDADYFYDGWNLGYFGERGDTIVIGGNAPATVVEANVEANTLVLDRSISWSEGDPIYFVDRRSGRVANDIGATQ